MTTIHAILFHCTASEVSCPHQMQGHPPAHTIALPCKQGVSASRVWFLPVDLLSSGWKPTRMILAILCQCCVWRWWAVSFAVNSHNSSTIGSYRRLCVWVCCCGQEEMIKDGFRMSRDVLLWKIHKYQENWKKWSYNPRDLIDWHTWEVTSKYKHTYSLQELSLLKIVQLDYSKK